MKVINSFNIEEEKTRTIVFQGKEFQISKKYSGLKLQKRGQSLNGDGYIVDISLNGDDFSSIIGQLHLSQEELEWFDARSNKTTASITTSFNFIKEKIFIEHLINNLINKNNVSRCMLSLLYLNTDTLRLPAMDVKEPNEKYRNIIYDALGLLIQNPSQELAISTAQSLSHLVLNELGCSHLAVNFSVIPFEHYFRETLLRSKVGLIIPAFNYTGKIAGYSILDPY